MFCCIEAAFAMTWGPQGVPYSWYNNGMDTKRELGDFIASRKELVWYVKDPRALSQEAVVQAVLNYGNWRDVQEIIRIMGIESAAQAFYRDIGVSARRRGNYYPDVLHYFDLYFKRHAHTT